MQEHPRTFVVWEWEVTSYMLKRNSRMRSGHADRLECPSRPGIPCSCRCAFGRRPERTWPDGDRVELVGVVDPRTDPTAHGGRAEDAFDVVLPSIPGNGFSAEPTELGWYSGRVAQAWAELMNHLGYTRYVAQGGDQGASVTDAMARQAPMPLSTDGRRVVSLATISSTT